MLTNLLTSRTIRLTENAERKYRFESQRAEPTTRNTLTETIERIHSLTHTQTRSHDQWIWIYWWLLFIRLCTENVDNRAFIRRTEWEIQEKRKTEEFSLRQQFGECDVSRKPIHSVRRESTTARQRRRHTHVCSREYIRRTRDTVLGNARPQRQPRRRRWRRRRRMKRKKLDIISRR